LIVQYVLYEIRPSRSKKNKTVGYTAYLIVVTHRSPNPRTALQIVSDHVVDGLNSGLHCKLVHSETGPTYPDASRKVRVWLEDKRWSQDDADHYRIPNYDIPLALC
jgi:hypothetical protein